MNTTPHSMADLIDRVETDGLGYTASSRVTVGRALRRHVRILDRRAEAISADPEALKAESDMIIWSAHGFQSQKSYRQHVAKVIGAAKRLAGSGLRTTGAGRVASDDVWQAVADAIEELPLPGKGQRVSCRAAWSTIRREALNAGWQYPSDLTDASVLAQDRILSCGRQKTWRSAIRALNTLIERRGEHPALAALPARALAVPSGRASPAFDWTTLSTDLRDEIHDVLTRLATGRDTSDDVLSPNGIALRDILLEPSTTARPYKPKTVALARAALIWVLRGQIEHAGRDPATLGPLSDLCTPEAVVDAVEAHEARQRRTQRYNKASSGPYQLAAHIRRIGKRFSEATPEVDAQWSRLLAALRDGRDVGCIATSRRRFLDELIRSEEMQHAWLTIDRRAWAAAETSRAKEEHSRFDLMRLLRDVEFAVLITLLVRVVPTRLSTLPAITFRGEDPILKLPRRKGDKALLDIPGHLVKNGERILVGIPPESLEILHGYLEHYRHMNMDLYGAHESDFLFPGKASDKSKSSAALAGIIRDGCSAFGFPGVTTHMARHFAAQLILEADPNAVGVAADWLADRPETVRQHYAVSNARAAAEKGRELLFNRGRR